MESGATNKYSVDLFLTKVTSKAGAVDVGEPALPRRRKTPIRFDDTVEPLSNDHPHQRPSLLYDHISCDGQCFLFVRSLTNDHPSNATNDRVSWNFLTRGRPYRVFQNEGVMNIR